MARKVLTEQENKNNQDFLELCKYIETDLFNYEPNMRLQKKAVLRLRGLSKGQVIANNKCQQFGEYPYCVILLAFKANKTKILNAIRNKDFNSEENKVAYISAIVRDQLNDIMIRYINAKKSQEKVETVNTDVMEYEGAEYQSRTDQKDNKNEDKFKDLW